MSKEVKELNNEELVEMAGSRVIGTEAGLKSQHAQAELTKRLMNSINNLNNETARYSETLVKLTVVLFAVAFTQLFVSVVTAPISSWGKVVLSLAAVLLIIYILRDFKKSKWQ